MKNLIMTFNSRYHPQLFPQARRKKKQLFKIEILERNASWV